MKKFLYSLLALTVASLSFVACDDEEGENGFKHDTHPEVTTAGTYVGQWRMTNSLNADYVQYEDGSITLSSTDSSYVTSVSVECPASDDINGTSLANISTMNENDYYFCNNFSTNGFGVKFYGQVEGDSIKFTFDKQSKKKMPGDRKARLVVVTFLFEGVKQ